MKEIKFKDNSTSEIACPDCGPATKLIVKTNKHNNSQFLACPNWPDCNYTREIPESWYMRASGQQELF